jgi:hypothetical protein
MDPVSTVVSSDNPSVVWLGTANIRPRIDATYYAAEYLRLDDCLAKQEGRIVRPLGKLLGKPRRILYLRTKTFERSQADADAIPFVSGIDIDGVTCCLNWQNVKYVQSWMLERYPKGELFPGAILIKVKGPHQLAAYVEQSPCRALVSGTCVMAGVQDVDPRFLVIYLTSPYAESWRTRLRQNITVKFTPYDELAEIPIVLPSSEIQLAIGNKVRKAERLRELAENAFRRFSMWLDTAAFLQAMPSEDLAYLKHSPDGTCPDSVWAVDFDGGDRIDPWPYHVAPQRIRLHLSQRANARPFEAILQVASGSRSRRAAGKPDSGDHHISVLDIDTNGHIDWRSAATNRYDGTGIEVYPGDILYSCLNPKETRIGYIPHDFLGRAVASPEFTVLRLQPEAEPAPHLVAAVLRSLWVRVQTSFLTRSSSLSRRRLDEDDLAKVLLPWSDEGVADLDSQLAVAVKAKHEAVDLITCAKSDVEALIDGTLDEAALLAEGEAIDRWLKDNPSPHAPRRAT